MTLVERASVWLQRNEKHPRMLRFGERKVWQWDLVGGTEGMGDLPESVFTAMKLHCGTILKSVRFNNPGEANRWAALGTARAAVVTGEPACILSDEFDKEC